MTAAIIVMTSLVVGATESNSEMLTQPWLYADVENRGPSNWGDSYESCGGKEQSPINIRDAAHDWELKFLELKYEPMEAVVVQNIQSTLKVKVSSSSNVVDPNQNNKKYHLAQMHIHSPSEHQIGGGLSDMELHLVHAEDDPSEEGSSHLVIAIMFSSGSNSHNTWLNKFMKVLPTLPLNSFRHYVNKDTEFKPHETATQVSVDPVDVFPGKRDFFTYRGSLTTPPCSEVVNWYVFKESVTMSVSQLDHIRSFLNFNGEEQFLLNTYGYVAEGLWGNNRPVQPIHGRTVTQFNHQAVNKTSAHAGENLKLGVIGTVLGTCILIASIIGLYIVCSSYCRRPSGKLPE